MKIKYKHVPFFSVIICCYNAREHIKCAVNSVLNQTMPDWELIIVDDASTDGTFQELERLAQLDPRISVHLLESNSGPAMSRNLAAKQARGHWLAILDSDDCFVETKLESQKKFILGKDPKSISLLATGTILEKSLPGLPTSIVYKSYPQSHKQLLENLSCFGAFPAHSSCVINREIFFKIGMYNPRLRYSEDKDLFFRLSEKGNLACLKEPLVKIKVRDDSLSAKGTISGVSTLTYSVYAIIHQQMSLVNKDKLKDDNTFFLTLKMLENNLLHSTLYKSWCLNSNLRGKTYVQKLLLILLHPRYIIAKLRRKHSMKKQLNEIRVKIENSLKKI